jgi:hypothetical protein
MRVIDSLEHRPGPHHPPDRSTNPFPLFGWENGATRVVSHDRITDSRGAVDGGESCPFGVRIEDIVTVTAGGGRRLNNTSHDLRIAS